MYQYFVVITFSIPVTNMLIDNSSKENIFFHIVEETQETFYFSIFLHLSPKKSNGSPLILHCCECRYRSMYRSPVVQPCIGM